jgi:hypothetical protein
MKNSALNCHVSAFAGPFVIKADAQHPALALLVAASAPKLQAKYTSTITTESFFSLSDACFSRRLRCIAAPVE